MTDPEATPDAPPAHEGRRRGLPMVLIVIASLLFFLGVLSIWINRQIVNTDNWANTSSQMLDNAAIRKQVSGFLVDQLYANVDVQGTLAQELPPRAKPLAGPAAGALHNLAEQAADTLLQRPRIQAAWEQANRRAHRRFLQVLNGGSGAVSTAGGKVTLDLNALLTATADRVGVGGRVADKIPPSAGQITILKSDQLDVAQKGLRALRHLPIVFVGLALLLSGLALALARGWRREAVRAWGIGLVGAGAAALLVKSIAGSSIVDALATTDSAKPAAQAVWDIGTQLLVQVATATILYGLLAVIGAWVAGPTRWATDLRGELAPYLREPRYAWGGFAAFILLIVWWGPTPATRNPVTGTLLAVLLAFGVEALRRQTAREHPDANLDAANERHRARLARWRDGLGGMRHAGTGAPAAAGAPSAAAQEAPTTAMPLTGDQRMAALERLGRLHADGVLDDTEFQDEKARVLGPR